MVSRYLATPVSRRLGWAKDDPTQEAAVSPPETKNMTLRMEEGMAENVQAIAEVEGTTVTEVIRTAITDGAGWTELP